MFSAIPADENSRRRDMDALAEAILYAGGLAMSQVAIATNY